jgi:hypothetical protein
VRGLVLMLLMEHYSVTQPEFLMFQGRSSMSISSRIAAEGAEGEIRGAGIVT